jgi:2-oxo-4-hydroxy-4-carboxy-5-ureidoimidazoline decarboxylase
MSRQDTHAELGEASPPAATGPGHKLRLEDFNGLERDAAMNVLRPCLDVDRWLAEVADGRPYASLTALQTAAREAADPLSTEEVEGALAHHPRIGERAPGSSAEATLSRSEQAGLKTSDDVLARLEAGNRAYEERFGRVFLIRAAGRSSEELVTALEVRLGNDPDTEDRIVADQLREIALLRLAGRVIE